MAESAEARRNGLSPWLWDIVRRARAVGNAEEIDPEYARVLLQDLLEFGAELDDVLTETRAGEQFAISFRFIGEAP